MKLTDRLTEYVNAACSGLWVHTAEPDEAEREIVRLAQERKWRIAVWDVAQGLRLPGSSSAVRPETAANELLPALRALPTMADPNGTVLLVLHQLHRFLNHPEVMQTLFARLVEGKRLRTFLVVLSPVVAIPIELEKLFVVIDHELPGREQLEQIARELTSDEPSGLPDEDKLARVLDAAAGLTRYEAETAFALSLARHGTLWPEVVAELKAQTLKKGQLLTLHRGEESFESLGGLQSLKDFCRRALAPRVNRTVKPRGCLLLGVPGTGKSAFAKALGNETGRPTLTLDLGALYGSLVGQTEQQIRQALKIADAMAPCICFVDELEKALSVVGGQGDSGVSTRLFGTLLTWLSDRTSDVFFLGTCNDISKLPPEFSRAERLDACFFLDLPTSAEKDAIWRLYQEQYGIPASQAHPDDTDWTGAEVRACCRLAALLDVPLTQAARQVVPVAVTAAEQVEKLRTWASGRCLSASSPGIYARDGGNTVSKSGRRVQRGPGSN
jgi:hypothetical protein